MIWPTRNRAKSQSWQLTPSGTSCPAPPSLSSFELNPFPACFSAKLNQLSGLKAASSASAAAAAGDSDGEDDAALDAADADDDPTDVTLSAEDQKDMEMYWPAATKERRTFADLIMEKLKVAEQKAKERSAAGGAAASSSSTGAAGAMESRNHISILHHCYPIPSPPFVSRLNGV